jgi:hypothetical protein
MNLHNVLLHNQSQIRTSHVRSCSTIVCSSKGNFEIGAILQGLLCGHRDHVGWIDLELRVLP